MTHAPKIDIRFGTSNVRSFQRRGTLKTVKREFRKHKLDLVGVQKVMKRIQLSHLCQSPVLQRFRLLLGS
jgi:hypothetical protein